MSPLYEFFICYSIKYKGITIGSILDIVIHEINRWMYNLHFNTITIMFLVPHSITMVEYIQLIEICTEIDINKINISEDKSML